MSKFAAACLALFGVVLVGCKPGASCSGPAVCAGVAAGHADNDPFASPTTVSGYTLTSLGGTPIYNQETAGLGLRFDPSGLRGDLPAVSCSVDVLVGVFASDVNVVGKNATGSTVATATVPHGTTMQHAILSASGMTQVELTGGGNEGVIFDICSVQ